MTLTGRDLRTLALVPIAVLLLGGGIGAWFLNPITQQYQFGALIACEFATLSMGIYIYLHEDLGKLSLAWYVLWWFFVAILLSLALY